MNISGKDIKMKKEIIVSGSFYSPVYEKIVKAVYTWEFDGGSHILKKVSIDGKERTCGGEREN